MVQICPMGYSLLNTNLKDPEQAWLLQSRDTFEIFSCSSLNFPKASHSTIDWEGNWLCRNGAGLAVFISDNSLALERT